MASSEFILAPRIDENKARKEMQKLDDVARRSAQQMTTEFDHAWNNIGRKGKSTFSQLGGWLRDASATMAGNLAAQAVAKIAEISVDAATKVFEDAQGTALLARERYEQNRDINSEADALGIDRGKYAAFDIAGVSAGLDTSDMRGLMSGFVGALEKPEMAKFNQVANKQGIDKAFLDFIGSTSKLNPETAVQRMNEVFGGEDALKASKFMKPIQHLLEGGKELNFQNIVDTMSGRHVDITGIEKALDLSEDQMKSMFSNDARLFEEHIKGVAKDNNAQNIIKSENSIDGIQNAKLDTLHVAVAKQVLMDNITKAEISTGYKFVEATTSKGQRIEDLWTAGGQSPFELSNWIDFSKKFLSALGDDPHAPLPLQGESLWEYFNRQQDYKSHVIKKSLTEQTEQHAQDNKTRNDTGPLK